MIAGLEKQYEGVRRMVGMDRLDYVKGVPQKLHAFDKFLDNNPD